MPNLRPLFCPQALAGCDAKKLFAILNSTEVEIQWRWHFEDTLIPCVSNRVALMNPLRYSKPMSLEETVENLRQRRSQARRLCCNIRCLNLTTCCELLTLEFATPAHAEAKLNDLLRFQQEITTHQEPHHDLVKPTWSTDNSHDLGFISAAAMFIDHLTSVTAAIDALKSGKIQCKGGYCIVYSQRKETFFLIWRSDVEMEEVIEMINAALKKEFEGSS